MIVSISELIEYYVAEISKSPTLSETLLVPGYSVEEVTYFEQRLGQRLPDSFVRLLLQLKLEGVDFCNMQFGVRQTSYLKRIAQMNTPTPPIYDSTDKYLRISSTDGHNVFLILATGEIGVVEDGYGDPNVPPTIVAPDFETLLCKAATLEQAFPFNAEFDALEPDDKVRRVRQFLNIPESKPRDDLSFWEQLALGWA